MAAHALGQKLELVELILLQPGSHLFAPHPLPVLAAPSLSPRQCGLLMVRWLLGALSPFLSYLPPHTCPSDSGFGVLQTLASCLKAHQVATLAGNQTSS